MNAEPAERVLGLLKEAGEWFVRPRFRALAVGEVTEKSAGEVVTVADREAGVFLA